MGIYNIRSMPHIAREALTADDIRAVVDYSPETGMFTWKVTTRGHGKMLHPGDEAGWWHDGYRMLHLYQEEYRAHRVAWFLMTGDWPPAGLEIDHDNRDRSDNRWANLRLATRSQNNINARTRADNTSGFRGVHRSKNGKWFARICIDRRVRSLGTFESYDAAVQARVSAERKAFGEFSPLRGAA